MPSSTISEGINHQSRAMDSKIPSKLQGIMKLPDLTPSEAFFATPSAFIAPKEAAMILVNCGFLLFSAMNVHLLLPESNSVSAEQSPPTFDVDAYITSTKYNKDHTFRGT